MDPDLLAVVGRRHQDRCRLPPAAGALAEALGRGWAWILGAAVLGYLALVPGTILLDQLVGVDSPGLVIGLTAFFFAGLIAAVVGARAQDRVRAG